MQETMQQVQALYTQVQGHEDCHQLVSHLTRALTYGSSKEWLSDWSDRKDAFLQLPWGTYVGKEGVERLLSQLSQDRRGVFDVHSALTECLEVAKDGLTAIGDWQFQALTTRSDGEARWLWYKAEIAFCVQDNAWKLWQMKVYPMYYTAFDEDWGKTDPTDWKAVAAKLPPDRPAETEPWHLGMPVSLTECYPPAPYQTWSEIEERRQSL